MNPEPNSSEAVRQATRQQLGAALGLGAGAPMAWRPEDLAAIFRHQMAASVLVDLGALDSALAGQFQALADGSGLVLRSFGDLFQHAKPPLELLRLVKDFARRNLNHPESVLPTDVASALYYLSIAAARIRWNERISSLGDGDLVRGFQWAMDQPWLDESRAALLRQAVQTLNRPTPP